MSFELNRVQIEIQKLLVEWDPLGDRKHLIEDLNNYEIEAIDLSMAFGLVNKEWRAIEMVHSVIAGGFNLPLTIEDCSEYGHKIWTIYLSSTGDSV